MLLFLDFYKFNFPDFMFSSVGFSEEIVNETNSYEYSFNIVIRYFSIKEITDEIYVQVCKDYARGFCEEWMTVNTIEYVKANTIIEEDIKFNITNEGLMYIVSYIIFIIILLKIRMTIYV